MKFIKLNPHKTNIAEAEMLSEYRRSGNLDIIGKLYANYMTLVFGLCLKYLNNEEKSKDAVMQIFEELIQKLKVHEVTNFKSWLYSVARNHCLMILRAEGKQQMINIDDSFVENESFQHLDFDPSREEKFHVMEDCMKRLPEEQRICIDLFYLQQKSYKEITDATHFDINKVKSYIQNGKRNLKICIEKERDNE